MRLASLGGQLFGLFVECATALLTVSKALLIG